MIKKGLTANDLKIIAIIAMTIDHVTWLVFPGYNWTLLPIILHIIGRLTAPTMMFLICEGYALTRNRKKYLGRLFLFAAISHIPYTMLFPDIVVIPGIPTTSVLWPYALGLLALMIHNGDLLPHTHKWQKTALVWLCFLAALPADWSMPAALAIYFMAQRRGDFKGQMMQMVIILFIYALVCGWLFNITYGLVEMAVVLVIPLLAAYNGQRGTAGGKTMKWLFYVYYPLHLAILGIIRTFFLSA
jgi:hypothetical protein